MESRRSGKASCSSRTYLYMLINLSASLYPVSMAPWTVEKCLALVASPAKNTLWMPSEATRGLARSSAEAFLFSVSMLLWAYEPQKCGLVLQYDLEYIYSVLGSVVRFVFDICYLKTPSGCGTPSFFPEYFLSRYMQPSTTTSSDRLSTCDAVSPTLKASSTLGWLSMT